LPRLQHNWAAMSQRVPKSNDTDFTTRCPVRHGAPGWGDAHKCATPRSRDFPDAHQKYLLEIEIVLMRPEEENVSPSANDTVSPSVTLATCTISARVAFVLTIAELASTTITARAPGKRVRSALDLAWRWQQSGDVMGAALDHVLENEDDDGLLVDESAAPEHDVPAWVAITSAIAYAAWHAFRREGASHMPETIGEVTEEVIDQVASYAREAPGLDHDAVDRLVRYCVEYHRAAAASERGAPVARAAMRQAAQSAA
jgi:Immunity protein Imm6